MRHSEAAERSALQRPLERKHSGDPDFGHAAGSFTHIERKMGLDRVRNLTKTRKPSPFCYRENVLLYLSESVPFPDLRDKEYLAAVAEEAGQLIEAAHGHAALLFTSYRAMDQVFALLEAQELAYPLFRLDRGGLPPLSGSAKAATAFCLPAARFGRGSTSPATCFPC